MAQQDVQAAINASGSYLPKDLPNPPVYSKVNPADAPILTLAMTSDTLAALEGGGPGGHAAGAEDLAALGRGPGIDRGGQKPAVRIQANPTAMANYGLSLEDMRTALGTANVDQAKGNLNGTRQAYTIGANDQLLSSRRLRQGDHRVPERIAGAADRMWRMRSTASENLFQAAWMGTSRRRRRRRIGAGA